MLLFTGQAEVSIDAKQRLAIPAKFRGMWDEARDGSAWYAVPWGDSIRLYTERRFEELASQGPQSLLPSPEEAALESDFFGLAERLAPDSAGRVLIPKPMLESAGLRSSEVVVIGARNRLEVRDKDAWNKTLPNRLASLPALAARMGGMLKAEPAPRPPGSAGT